MTRSRSLAFTLGGASMALAALLATDLPAQITAPGFASKPMLASTITGVEGKEVVILSVVIEPGASSPRHTHPGDCYGSIVEGEVELLVEGQAPRRFTAGQAWHNPRGPAHSFRSVGTTPARLINTLIVDQGKPRTEIVAAPQK